VSISLTHTGTTVELTHFRATAELPRSKDPQSSLNVAYSYHGNAYPTGPRRTVERWQFTALVSEDQWRMLQLIEDKSVRAARTAPYTGYEILLFDSTKAVTEAVPSRAAFATLDINPDGSTTYLPVWMAMFESLELEMQGNKLWAIASLAEGNRTTPELWE
jgi:hypothetical protein